MKILDRIEEGICIICLIAMTALVFANVCCIFHSPSRKKSQPICLFC